MLTGTLAIQCTASNGEVGSFLFTKEEGKPINESQLLTPVFSSLIGLFVYIKEDGWQTYWDGSKYYKEV